MNLNQKLVALGLMLFLSVGLITAQNVVQKGQKMTPEERAKKQTERMVEQLGLSDKQAKKVAAINLEYANKMQAAKAQSPEKEGNWEAMKAMRTEKQTAIKALLTTEQLAKMEALQQSKEGHHGKKDWKGKKGEHGRKAGMEGKGKNPEERAQMHTQRMVEQLSLSPAQADQLTAINQQYAQKMKAIKGQSTENEDHKAAMKTMHEEKQAAIKAILTPEQVTKMEAMHQGKEGKTCEGQKGHKAGKGPKPGKAM